jgi:hypothetical protein
VIAQAKHSLFTPPRFADLGCIVLLAVTILVMAGILEMEAKLLAQEYSPST